MSSTNRATLINKLYKTAKKHFTPITPPSDRTVLEHAVYACCLENSTYEAADEAFAKLQDQFFDWNEIRVTTSVELAEVMKGLVDPMTAAISLKKTLQGVFETFYDFELNFLKKENLRKTVQKFEQIKGVRPFVVSYIAQTGLAGHSIPLDQAALNMMVVLGILNEKEVLKGKIPGLERTIAKNKGIEFGSLLHQLAAEFHRSPFSKGVRDILLSIEPSAKERFPKRAAPKKKPTKKAAATPAKKTAAKPAAKKAPVKKKTAAKKATVKKAAPKKKVAKKAPTKKAATKKKTTKKAAPKKRATKSATKKLSKRKPR